MRLCIGVLAVLVLAAGGTVVLFAIAPATEETVIAIHNGSPGWRITLSYQPNATLARLSLRMDTLAEFHTVAYSIESTEPWVSTWQGRMEGRLSESVELHDELETPEPMTSDLAKRIARSFRIVLTSDGRDQVLDFHDAGFAQPVPLLDQLRSQLFGFRSRVVG